MSRDVLKNVLTRLQAELRRANEARATLREKNREHLRKLLADEKQRETRDRLLIDDACRHWIETGAWPKMDSDHASLVWERLNHGLLFGQFLHEQGGLRVLQKTESEVLDFLLVDVWAAVGVHRLHSKLFDTQ